MLAIAREKAAAVGLTERLTLVEGDMTAFDLGRRFATILVPFRAFQLLLTPADQRRALACLRRHLEADGRLIINLFDPDLRYLLPESSPREKCSGIDRVTGQRIEAEQGETVFDYVAQVRHNAWRLRLLDAAGRTLEEQELVLSLRWTYRWEMRHLLALAGIAVATEHGDFQGGPPAYAGEQILICHLTDVPA